MLCHRACLYTTLRAPGLIIITLAQSFLFALGSQVTSPSATFLGSNKGQENKGQGALSPRAGGILFPPTHVLVLQDFYDKHYFPPAHSFMVPDPAQPIFIVSLSAESLHHAGYQKPPTLLVTSPTMTAEALC